MPHEQPDGSSSSEPFVLDELLLQLERLRQSNDAPAYISLLQQILQLLPREDDPSLWAALQFALGNALHQSQEGDRKARLTEAISCYDAALTIYTPERNLANRVAVQQYKRSALSDLAELQEGVERLETLKSIAACCDNILALCAREMAPTNWAVAQYHKAVALDEIAEVLEGEERFRLLEEACSCYDAALTVYTRQNSPLEWATTQNGKGTALYKLAQLCEGKKQLAFFHEAIACYDNALQVFDTGDTRLYHATVQYNKGTILLDLAETVEGFSKKEILQNALVCFEDALFIYSQQNDRLSCAREQSSTGNALYELSKILRGTEHVDILYAALNAYDAALDIYTSQLIPTDWAMVQNNKGNVLLSLAEQLREAEREETLQQALTCCDEALTIYTRTSDPVNWSITLRNKGNILRALSELTGGEKRKEMLQRSLACFDAVLSEPREQLGSLNWARTQNDKGLALHLLSRALEAAESEEALRLSLACYDAALPPFSGHNDPLNRAEIHNNKSVSLSSLAELQAGEERRQTLQAALASCDTALTLFTPTTAPYSWALTQSNRGNVLRKLAEMYDGSVRLETLQKAIACYNDALTVFSRAESPLDWARIQHNKGAALRNMMQLLAGSERLQTLRSAIGCYDAALLERKREITPFDWATTQESRGNAFLDLAELLEGDEQMQVLQAALACFDAALLENHQAVTPINWARVQNNKGNLLHRLARAQSNAGKAEFELLSEACHCYDAALLEYSRELAPIYWAMAQSNKGVVLNDLARIAEEVPRHKELLQQALDCFDAALLEYQREVDPVNWATLQVNRGGTLCNLAGLQEGEIRSASLRKALLCYDAALDVYTLSLFPAHHHRIAYAIGMRLFDESEWVPSAKYLGKALNALDSLFTLEVTARGRKATLIPSGDLTAHLAYALIRTGDPSQGLQAAEALERGRARATREAIARQEAQLAAAERLTPELLEQFREASNRVVAITMKDSGSITMRESMAIPEDMTETQAPLELVALNALNQQLAGYEEARQARAVYDELVALIRQSLPDFLRQNDALEAATKELRTDERLAYVATTPVGAVALCVSGSATTHSKPIVEGWWDEQLTSTRITQLLVGSPGEKGKRRGGLLAAQAHAGRLCQALRSVMEMLGMSNAVLAHLAAYCQRFPVRRLVLIPCGLLGLLPLHAALVPCSTKEEVREPLLDVVQVSYAPSARIWMASRRRAAKTSAGEIQALIVADPQPQSDGTPPLPGAKDEAGRLLEIISKTSGDASVLRGEAATLTATLDTLQRQGTSLTHAHFACHGLADLAYPQTSGVLLAYGARLMTRDLLDPAFVRFAQLRLAVLAACRTALIGTELPDEVVGLPSAWLQVGAKSVLASLWPISDSWTVALMTKFYELHLLDECEPVEALWLAQRWLRGLPSWREDCRAAGAVRAAEGPEVNEIVFERGKVPVRGECIDEQENHAKLLVEEHELAEEGIKAFSGMSTENRDANTWRQQWFWEDARHWAAFVIYGT